MADDQLAELFADGTAPERDAAFARRVDARISLARLRQHLLVHAMRALVVLTLAGAAFVALRTLEPMIEPTLDLMAEISPQIMGVPAPLILTALVVGLAVRLRRFVRLRLG
jgi:hypothetical protein